MTGQRYIDNSYRRQNPRWHAEDSPWKAEQILAMLAKHRLEPKTVCDVGCGAGVVLSCLEEALGGDVRYSGYDISPDAIALCREPGKRAQISFFEGDFLALDTEVFDLLLLIDVFEHVEDYMGLLRALSGRARYFIFHIPLDLHVSSVIRSRPIIEAREAVGHLHYFTRETALATLADTGFLVVDEAFTAGGLELDRFSLATRLARFPRRFLRRLSPQAAARWLGGFSLLVLAKTA